jgi:hypothetical protein
MVRAPRGILKLIYRRLVGERPPDPVRAWRGTAIAGQPPLRVLHVGDCGVRRMECSHDLLGPPGYPLTTARELVRFGVGLTFLHYFCVNFEELPDLEVLAGFSTFGAPDVLLVQVGSAYTRRVILPDTARVHQLRDELGRRAGRFVFSFYRLLFPFVRVFGRHSTPYRGVGQLERFVAAARSAWPAVQVVLVLPFRRCPGYPTGEAIGTRVESDLRALAAAAPGVSVFDANRVLGSDPALRCVTGYNLNARGSELVGAALARWLTARIGSWEADSQGRSLVS